jgi:hypothetical protein
LKYERGKRALTSSRFSTVTPRADKNFRAWFLLPDYKSRNTADDTFNSFV